MWDKGKEKKLIIYTEDFSQQIIYLNNKYTK